MAVSLRQIEALNDRETLVYDAAGESYAAAGTKLYPNSATDPVSPSPADGDRYYNTTIDMWMAYDATRAKWLSIAESMLAFGRNGNTAGGSYYRALDGLAYNLAIGRYAEFNGTVVSLAYTRSDTDSATFEVVADGTGIATLVSTAVGGKSATLNGDFSANQILGVRNQTGSNTTSNVAGWVRVRWRA